jgi:glycosyltransferase involved in cell wall biosynthesis
MNLVHTESSCGWGGQEIRILSEAAGMIERRHKVTLLCPREARIFAAAQARGIPVVSLPLARKHVTGVLALRRWLKSNKADVLNCHSSTDTWLAALASRMLRTAPPLVRTRHISAPLPRNRMTRWLYVHATSHIVTTGEALRQDLLRTLNCPPQRVTSIPTGIDTALYSPGGRIAARQRLGLPQQSLLIGIVATLRSWKGHRYLIDAFSQLRSPERRLIIVGDGPQSENIKQQVMQLKLGDQVEMPGNRDDVLAWLQALDIFALPSYANEGVPQGLVQAMLCGLPCVTTKIGAIGEAAIADETALVVAPQDVEALRAALQALINEPAWRERLGRAARAHCVKRFSREAMLDRMEAVFYDAIGASARRG